MVAPSHIPLTHIKSPKSPFVWWGNTTFSLTPKNWLSPIQLSIVVGYTSHSKNPWNHHLHCKRDGLTMVTMAIWPLLRSTYSQITSNHLVPRGPIVQIQRLFNISKKSLPQSANIAMLRLGFEVPKNNWPKWMVFWERKTRETMNHMFVIVWRSWNDITISI